MVETKPLPGTEEEWVPHWSGLVKGELRIQHCTSCDHYQFPPSSVCAMCNGAVEWRAVPGEGVVHTFIIEHMVYHPGFANDVPYNVTVVQLDEGPYLLTNLVGIANDEIRIGQRVQVHFDDVADGATVAKFRPVERA